MSHPPMIYGIGPKPTNVDDTEISFAGAAGRLPGHANTFAAGILINLAALGDVDEDVSFGNDTGAAGWGMLAQRSAVDPAVIVATINFRVVGGPNNELVVPIGSSGWHWLFLAFTVNPGNQGQPPVVAVFANGELVYQASLNDDVIPSPGAPSIQMASALGTLLSWAFYTEAPMSEVFPALLQLQLKENAGAVSWSAFGGSPQLQHIYSASESMRPLSDVWADIGSVPNAPLTLDTEEDGTLSATVRSGDFASPAVGAIVDPSGPSGP